MWLPLSVLQHTRPDLKATGISIACDQVCHILLLVVQIKALALTAGQACSCTSAILQPVWARSGCSPPARHDGNRVHSVMAGSHRKMRMHLRRPKASWRRPG